MSSDPFFDTSDNISRADLKINLSGDRLMRADLRRQPSPGASWDDYMLLPKEPAKQTPYHWWVELDGLSGAMEPVRLEIAGDVIMGIWRGKEEMPDLDLGVYSTENKGVSRQHAVLRPSKNRLYLIDLKSTNGTRVNKVQISNTMVTELHDMDIVTLGVLSFTLRIVATPQG